MINAIKMIKKENIEITDAYVIINRLEGANEGLQELGVSLHSLIDIKQIAQILYQQNLISYNVLEEVKNQTSVE